MLKAGCNKNYFYISLTDLPHTHFTHGNDMLIISH